MAASVILLCFVLMPMTFGYLICGFENQCKCGTTYVTCKGSIAGVPAEARNGKVLLISNFDLSLRLVDIVNDLDGYSYIEIYGTDVCKRKDLQAVASLSDCSSKLKEKRHKHRESTENDKHQDKEDPELHKDIRKGVIKYFVGVTMTSLAVGTMTCITLSCIMIGLFKTYQRINNLHMHTEKPPCIIKWTLFNLRIVYWLLRLLCCCKECKNLETPTLEGKLFIIVFSMMSV